MLNTLFNYKINKYSINSLFIYKWGTDPETYIVRRSTKNHKQQ